MLTNTLKQLIIDLSNTISIYPGGHILDTVIINENKKYIIGIKVSRF